MVSGTDLADARRRARAHARRRCVSILTQHGEAFPGRQRLHDGALRRGHRECGCRRARGRGDVAARPTPNYEGLWWSSPAGSESGWGINLAHQGDVIFATWFTYDPTGKAWWLSMTANRDRFATSYAGTLYQTHGPAFSAVPFNPAAVHGNRRSAPAR